MRIIFKRILCCLLVMCLSGCAGITTSGDPRDPFEGFNRSIYSFNQLMDDSIFNPISKAYRAIMPDIINRGISNFFSNINDITVILNDVLQLKIGQAVSDIARFIFNTTIGLLGFFDISTQLGLPKHKEDFGQTLAKYGFGPGPFLVLPFIGPSSIRDVAGIGIDSGLLSPVGNVDNSAKRAGLLTLEYVDFKVELLSANKLISEAALDEYEFTKNAYFEYRNNLINDGESYPEGLKELVDASTVPEIP